MAEDTEESLSKSEHFLLLCLYPVPRKELLASEKLFMQEDFDLIIMGCSRVWLGCFNTAPSLKYTQRLQKVEPWGKSPPGSAFGSRLLVTLHALFLSPSVYACGHIEFGTLLLPRRLQRGGGKVAINKAFCNESQEGSSLSRSPLSPTSQQFGNYHAETVFKQSTGVTYVRWH